jgi:DNA-binding transcriptional LysR family regulator
VGFVHTPRVPPGFSSVLVSRQPFVACVPAAHPLARRKKIHLADLATEPFALVSRSVSPDYRERLLGLCTDHGFAPAIRYELRHWLSVAAVVSQGLAVALVPAALRQTGLAGAAFVPLDRPTPHYETRCLWKTGREPVALAAFLDHVRAMAQPLE